MTPSASTSDPGDEDGNSPPTEPEDPASQETPTHWPAWPSLTPPHLTLWPLDRQHSPVKLFCASLLLLETNYSLQPSFLSNCLAFSSDTCALLLAGVETENMGWVQACGLVLAAYLWVYSGSMWEKSFLLYDFSPFLLLLHYSLSNQQSSDTNHAPIFFSFIKLTQIYVLMFVWVDNITAND